MIGTEWVGRSGFSYTNSFLVRVRAGEGGRGRAREDERGLVNVLEGFYWGRIDPASRPERDCRAG